MKKEILLEVQGLGIIMYSDFATKHIKEGDNYLEKNYWEPTQVADHIKKGTIVAFSTGSPGQYLLKFHRGYPFDMSIYEFVIRLGIEVRDNTIQIRDLYDLLNWQNSCPSQQSIDIENGFYHITLCTSIPDSGVIGDNQDIDVYLNKLETMPELNYYGVPELCY
jgi:hypothetical protein